jgi:glycosyltransferase involved in cell wall biosynthesis
MKSATQPVIFLIVGDTVRNPGRSGIQTVVRSLAAAFGAQAAPVRPVVWKANSRFASPLPPEYSAGLGAEPLRDPPGTPLSLLWTPMAWPAWLITGRRMYLAPIHLHPRHRRELRGSWILLPELMYRGRAADLVAYAHRHGARVAAILHDAIPIQHPEFVPPDLPADHAEYMCALSHADLILPNSEASAEGWREFMAREKLVGPPVRTCTLACDLPGIPRELSPPAEAAPGAPMRILCVSTLEPRKNHRTLLEAYELATAKRPDLHLELDLVGAPYIGAQEIVDAVRRSMARRPGLRWHERIEHSLLRQLYEQAQFTVYPSVLEGFGLPVIESLWFGRPCVCANFGVMAENARGGGCLTVDVRDPSALAAALLEVAGNPDLRRRLAREATERKLKTWDDYATEVRSHLTALG